MENEATSSSKSLSKVRREDQTGKEQTSKFLPSSLQKQTSFIFIVFIYSFHDIEKSKKRAIIISNLPEI